MNWDQVLQVAVKEKLKIDLICDMMLFTLVCMSDACGKLTSSFNLGIMLKDLGASSYLRLRIGQRSSSSRWVGPNQNK